MPEKGFTRWLMAALSIVLLILLIGGYWFYRAQERQLRKDAAETLQAIEQLKVNEIAAWRAERLGNAAMLTDAPLFIQGVERWMADPQAELGEDILSQFRALQQHYHYFDILLVDANAQVRLSLSGRSITLNDDVTQTLAASFRDGQPKLNDLQPGLSDLPPHIDAIAPLFASRETTTEAVGAVILQSDASQFLYPLIQSWPTPSNSAETLLVRRDGDSVLFLNALRFRQDAALSLRIPLDQTDVPAVKAVLGAEGVVQGRDYRGTEVLAALQSIPDSSWYAIAKVDTAEVFADWHIRSRLILGLILGAVAAIVTAEVVVWQRYQRIHYQTLFEVEKAQQESDIRYHTTLLSIGDGVIVTNPEGSVTLLNPVAEALSGWSQDDAYEKPLEEVFHIVNEETRHPVENPVRRAMREGTVVGLANHTLLIAKNGREIPIADSAAPIRDANGSLTGMVLVFRDQTGERAAQDALQASLDKLELLFNILPIGISVLNQEYKITIQNPALEKILEISQESSGRDEHRHRQYLRADGTPMPVEEFASTRVINGEPFANNVETGVIKENGELIWTSVSAAACPLSDWKVVIVTTDITDRRRTEEALRESEARFRRAVADAPLPMLIHAEDGEIIVVNEAWTEITGYKHADIPTIAAWTERAYGENKQVVQADIDQLYSLQKRSSQGEYLITTRSGEQRTWDFSSSPLGLLPDGRRLVLSMAMDVTERKRAEEALQRYAERLAAINRLDHVISSNLEIASIYDTFVKEMLALVPLDRTSIVLINEVGDQWGVVRQWTQHQPEILPGEWRPVKGSAIDWLVTNRVPFLENEVGERGTWVETAPLQREGIRARLLLPLITHEGVIGALTAARREPNAFSEEDQFTLTAIADQLAIAIQNTRLYEQVQSHAADLEQRVAERTGQLTAANQELEAFTYSVSHDLRAPLRALDGFSSALLSKYDTQLDEKGRHYLARIQEASRRMGQLIEDLLNLSRITRREMSHQKVDLAELARMIAANLQADEPQRQVEFIIADEMVVQGDLHLLQIALENLIHNAWKFTGRCALARIEVGMTPSQAGGAAYFIRDNGVGFDMIYADKLFVPFQRLHAVHEFPGTGIGLVTVQRIITRHGGRVWTEAAIDQGATFYFTLGETE